MESTFAIKSVLLPIFEKDPKFHLDKVDEVFWLKLAIDLLYLENDIIPIQTDIYSLELDFSQKIISKLPNIHIQFIKLLAENYYQGTTSDTINYLLETNNKIFTKEINFLQTMSLAIKRVERKQIKLDLPKSYERLIFELSETDISNVSKIKGREDLREKFKQWNKELGKLDLTQPRGKDSETDDQLTLTEDHLFTNFPVLKDSKIKFLTWLKHIIGTFVILILTIYNYKILTSKTSLTPSVKNKVTVITETNDYYAIVVLDKIIYYEGEKVTGKVVLCQIDSDFTFTRLKGPIRIENGQVAISLIAGSVGEQKITGQLNIARAGQELPLNFSGNYFVIPRPNSANISADKMNIVYRGLVNPISVSFDGLDRSKIVASGTGLTYAGIPGKYNMIPQSGSEVFIYVTATLPSGIKVTDKKAFRIVGIPNPLGTLRGETGLIKGPKSNLEMITIGALVPNFNFDIGLEIIGFNFKVVGYPTIVVQGNKLNAQCKSVLTRLKSGDQIIISEIKIKLIGSDILLPRTAPVIYEIQ